MKRREYATGLVVRGCLHGRDHQIRGLIRNRSHNLDFVQGVEAESRGASPNDQMFFWILNN